MDMYREWYQFVYIQYNAHIIIYLKYIIYAKYKYMLSCKWTYINYPSEPNNEQLVPLYTTLNKCCDHCLTLGVR